MDNPILYGVFWPTFLHFSSFWIFLHNYALCSFISKNGPLARRRRHWRLGSVCRRQFFWRAYVRLRVTVELTWHVPRRRRSWRRGRRHRSRRLPRHQYLRRRGTRL
jgi:hypothetical protein